MATSSVATAATTFRSQDFLADIEKMRPIIDQSITSATDYLTKDLTACDHKVLNIAVVGASNQGKSSFINSIRRLKSGDDGAAPVGVTETTKTIECYPDKRKPNLIYWDLPGCGTSNFPRSQYKKLVQLDKYDFFLIISSKSFTENDGWLAKEIAQLGKCFYFI